MAKSDIEIAQEAKMLPIKEVAEKAGIDCGMAHLCNSPALLRGVGPQLDAVRIGSAFTGRVAGVSRPDLRSAALLQGEVIALRTLPCGWTVGYGARLRLRREMPIAVVNLGRRDGLPLTRRFHRPLKLCLNGTPCPVVGPVGQEQLLLDVRRAGVAVGDVVTVDLNPLQVPSEVPRIHR